MSAPPSVTVTVVSDYRGGEEKSWNDLHETLAALARQDFDEPIEFILLENQGDLERMPADLPDALPGVRVLGCDAKSSYEMKNIGAREASAELVAVLDADCIPDRGWLRAGVESMRAHPDALAISGRTTYPGRTTIERALALLSRSFVDRGQAGPIRLLSTNNMIGRREPFCVDPLPENAGAFAYRLLTEKWLREGGKLYFEPCMKVVHDFEGWTMERDLRAQVGWTSIHIRQLDRQIPGARVVQLLGVGSIPLLYAYRLIESTSRSLRLTRHFGLRWWHLPLLLGLAVRVHTFEIPGMLRALRGRDEGNTVYR